MNPQTNSDRGFLKLIETNRQRILKVCHVYAATPHDRDDLYQEILLQIWRGLPNLREQSYAGTWVYRVALNTVISFLRRNKSHGQIVPAANSQLIEWSDQRQPAEPRRDDPRIESLYQAIARLNVYERALLTLYLEDLSYEQIAEVMGISANHVGVMLHRAKAKLSGMMQEVTT